MTFLPPPALAYPAAFLLDPRDDRAFPSQGWSPYWCRLDPGFRLVTVFQDLASARAYADLHARAGHSLYVATLKTPAELAELLRRVDAEAIAHHAAIDPVLDSSRGRCPFRWWGPIPLLSRSIGRPLV